MKKLLLVLALLLQADRANRIGDGARELATALASKAYGWALSTAEAQRQCAEAAERATS
jgi:hypothetical protein